MATLFSLVLIAALVGIAKPYIPQLNRWHFAGIAVASFVIVGVSASPSTESSVDAVPKADGEQQAKIVATQSRVKPEPARTPLDRSQKEPVKTNEKTTSKGETKQGFNRSAQIDVVEASKSGIKKRLRDPDSARFRKVGYYSGGGMIAVCGEVNAKNGFGGRGGFERFIAAGKNVAFLESDTSATEFREAWQTICVNGDGEEIQFP